MLHIWATFSPDAMYGTKIKSWKMQLVGFEEGPEHLKCAVCGLEVDLPFKCNYCEQFYCPEHRLPENHSCVESWRVKALRSARTATSPVQVVSSARSMLLSPQPRKVRFSPTEVKHLSLGFALVTAAGISAFLGTSQEVGILGLAVATALFSLGFIVHELAHKYVAQGYGLWAEFRVNTTGLLLTALSVISPIKFIAPGAVMIAGYTDKTRMGRTAVAGPLVNIIITAALLILLPVLATRVLYDAILVGASINAFLALFNLIPFAVFDGQKVYSWDKRYWAIMISISLALTVYTSFILRPLA